MRFAVSIPQLTSDGMFDPIQFRDYLIQAESLGFEGAWTQEAVLSSAPILSPLELMTFAAACTKRLRLGCAVFVSTLHSPLHLAKSLSTLDQISRGRVEVGVALGRRGPVPLAFGVDPDTLVSRFLEGLQLMKACWTETQITFTGRYWKLSDGAMEPKPFQKPHPPIWLGGIHSAAVRRAVHYGNGFFGSGSSTTSQFSEQVRVIHEELAKSKQDMGHFQIAKRVYIAVTDKSAQARERAHLALTKLYGNGLALSDLSALAIYGSPETCINGLREVVQAGAQLIQLHFLFDDAKQMDLAASEVLPYVA